MKKRTSLILITVMSFVFLLVSGLVADRGTALGNQDSFIYLPFVTDFSDLLFRDDFSNPDSGWPVDDDGLVQWSYEDDQYQMLIRDTGVWAGALAPINGLTNYNIRASMHRVQGSASDVGLVFDWKDWDNFYYLVMDPGDQWFGVAKVVNGSPSIVIDRTDSALIFPGNATNRLRIDREGEQIAVSINGQRLVTVPDKGFPPPFRAGLYMESDNDAPAINRYDDVEIWRSDVGGQQGAALHTVVIETPFASGDGFDAALNWETEE